MRQNIDFMECVGIDTLLCKQKALLYPAASGADYFLRYLRARHGAFLDRVVGLADRDPHKQGLCQQGFKVFAPAELKGLGLDVVVVTSSEHFPAMRAELAELLGPGVQIILADTLREYWDEAAKLSALAARAATLAPLGPQDWPQEDLGSFFHAMPLGPGQFTRSTKGILTCQFLEQIRLPQDLTGMRVLDLAASDGFYSFECEARGAAEVLSVEGPGWLDRAEFKRYSFAHRRYNSKTRHLASWLEDLDAEALGAFDLTLCLGLYYHLRDPFFCLRKLYTMTRGTLIVTGRTVRHALFDPFATGHPGQSGQPGQPASFMMLSDKGYGKWTANTHALIDMLKIAGFSRVDVLFDFCPEGSLIASTALAAHK
jgi:tRNA (mo5U34)-methyltransferase